MKAVRIFFIDVFNLYAFTLRVITILLQSCRVYSNIFDFLYNLRHYSKNETQLLIINTIKNYYHAYSVFFFFFSTNTSDYK
jgi:hypothetical protein